MANRITLWDDNPSEIDLLGFEAVVTPILSSLADPNLDPLTIGVHGPWGSGKSTILGLLEIELAKNKEYLVIKTNPWEYDDQNDVKGSLIADILGAIEEKYKDQESVGEKILGLMKRISWSRVGIAVAQGAITMKWDPEELVEAFTPKKKSSPDSMTGFRKAFSELLDEFPDIKKVVVLVDDLDRCLPSSVVATLEAIKLFLSVPKMVFALAADQNMVRDAIASYLGGSPINSAFAGHYLEKIVQLPITLPRLSIYEAEAYISLLLIKQNCKPEEYTKLVNHCKIRRENQKHPIVAEFDSLECKPPEDLLDLAGQLAYGLGSDKVTNPREVKRFLNAFGVRGHIAAARKLNVKSSVIAKLLLLEDRYHKSFETLAKTSEAERGLVLKSWEEWAKGNLEEKPDSAEEHMRQWAASEPSLKDEPIGPYITLAATLSTASVSRVIRQDLAAIITRLLGQSEADKNNALDQLIELPSEDQLSVVSELFSVSRRMNDVDPLIDSVIRMGKSNPEIAAEIAEGIESNLWNKLDAAAAVDLAMSDVPDFTSLAGKLADDEGIDGSVRKAAQSALKPKG